MNHRVLVTNGERSHQLDLSPVALSAHDYFVARFLVDLYSLARRWPCGPVVRHEVRERRDVVPQSLFVMKRDINNAATRNAPRWRSLDRKRDREYAVVYGDVLAAEGLASLDFGCTSLDHEIRHTRRGPTSSEQGNERGRHKSAHQLAGSRVIALSRHAASAPSTPITEIPRK